MTTTIWSRVRTGDWLTAERRRLYPATALAVTAAISLFWIVTSHGLIDRVGHPIGTDFSSFYAAGDAALHSSATTAYDPAAQYARERMLFGAGALFYAWQYPPLFLLVVTPLAPLPYWLALVLWQGVTLLLLLGAIRAIIENPRSASPDIRGSARGSWLIPALGFPAVFINLIHGQNGFLTACLIGSALLLLDQRPWTAGVLIGLLAYKPQFAVLMPVALIVSLRWRTFAAAGVTVVAASAASAALFGTGIWTAFLASAEFTRRVLLEGGAPGWEKIQSVFSAVRMWGGTVGFAYGAQIVLALTLVVTLVWLWRTAADFDLKASALVIASLLATPFVLDYDLVVLAVAGTFLVRHGIAHGFRPYEITALAFAWAAPLLTRPIALYTGVPLGLISMLLLYGLTIRHAIADSAEAQARESRLGQQDKIATRAANQAG